MQLSLYVQFHHVRHRVSSYEVERAYRNGHLVFSSRQRDVIKPKDSGSQGWYADSFTPWHPGHFRVTGAFVSAGMRKQKSVWFWVVARGKS